MDELMSCESLHNWESSCRFGATPLLADVIMNGARDTGLEREKAWFFLSLPRQLFLERNIPDTDRQLADIKFNVRDIAKQRLTATTDSPPNQAKSRRQPVPLRIVFSHIRPRWTRHSCRASSASCSVTATPAVCRTCASKFTMLVAPSLQSRQTGGGHTHRGRGRPRTAA